jgi:hypothetical protein
MVKNGDRWFVNNDAASSSSSASNATVTRIDRTVDRPTTAGFGARRVRRQGQLVPAYATCT